MKKILFLLLLLFPFYAFSASDEVYLGNGEWPPYLSEKMESHGLGSKIVTKAFENVGIHVNYSFYPWGRAYELGKKGKLGNKKQVCCDGTLLWRGTPEREQDFYISDPVIESGYVFFSLKKLKNKQGIYFDRLQWEHISDLKEFTIGRSLNYVYGDEFKQLEDNKIIHTLQSATDLKNLKGLLNNEIQIFPLPLVVGLNMINENFNKFERERLTFNPKEFALEPLCLLLSKTDPRNAKRIQLFNEGLKKLKESGEYNKIYSDFKEKLVR